MEATVIYPKAFAVKEFTVSDEETIREPLFEVMSSEEYEVWYERNVTIEQRAILSLQEEVKNLKAIVDSQKKLIAILLEQQEYYKNETIELREALKAKE